jgi:hypothetical protein
MKMVFGRPEKAESFFGDLKVTRARVGGRRIAVMLVFGRSAHTVVCTSKASESIPENNLEL